MRKHYKPIPTDSTDEEWDTHFLQLAENVSKHSYDPVVKVGMVIVLGRTPLAWGHNRFPEQIPNKPIFWKKSVKKLRVIHAEVSAIGQAAKRGVAVEGATIYGTLFPCNTCALTVIAAGIKKVVCQRSNYASDDPKFKNALKVLNEAGVKVDLKEYPKSTGEFNEQIS